MTVGTTTIPPTHPGRASQVVSWLLDRPAVLQLAAALFAMLVYQVIEQPASVLVRFFIVGFGNNYDISSFKKDGSAIHVDVRAATSGSLLLPVVAV